MPWKAITAIIGICIPLTTALILGYNGLLLTLGMSLIAGIAGVALGRTTKK